MSKKIKLKNSTILLIGFFFILIGLVIGFYEFFEKKKDETFSRMNLLLYDSEIPDNINSDDEIISDIEDKEENNTIENPENNYTDKEPTETQYDYIGILEIPKINLKRGFLDLNSRYNKVNYNITVINGSTYPDQDNNNLILAAHSGVCSVCFFNKLYKLQIDDVAYISYKNVKYYYKITNIYEVNKDGTVAIYRDYTKNTLTLITCTRNSDTKQTVYILELYNKENY